MRKVTFNKAGARILTVDPLGRQKMAVCLFCKKNEVPLSDWNKRCDSCRAKQAKHDEAEKKRIDSGVAKRQPAAVLELENGQKVFVDKFGREVDNPGYDLKNDPRGWRKTGNLPPPRSIIK